ncbi:MAG: hypothetical protein ACLPUG_07830 [Acidimicrobiales bacterium]
MGALAQTDRGVGQWPGEKEPPRPERSPARRARSAGGRRTSWNVLAEELVPFPPPAAPTGGRPRQRPPRRAERAGTRPPAQDHGVPLQPQGCDAGAPYQAATSRRAAPTTPVAAGLVARATPVRSRQVAHSSRGLRRLLPGAATLAVLASLWLGAGALSNLQRPALRSPAAAVKVSGGYLYIARPGDTLWSIASALEPGGDPRPLVAQLEQQLHGGELVAGDRLILP